LDNYPFPIRDDVNFRCVGCGRCCDSAPQLSISEAIRLVDDFPLMASIVSMQTAAAPGIVRPLVPLQPAGIVESGF